MELKREYIWIIEPFYGGSHKQFLDGFQREILPELPGPLVPVLFSLPARHWHWRFAGSHFTLAQKCNEYFTLHKIKPRFILTTSLMDTSAFRGSLSSDLRQIPILHYMHENQLEYPTPQKQEINETAMALKEHVYPVIHLNQIFGSDHIIFNSSFHKKVLTEHLFHFIKTRPEKSHEIEKLLSDRLHDSSLVIPVGIYPFPAQKKDKTRKASLLWNHRWEYDKGPEEWVSRLDQFAWHEDPIDLYLIGGRARKDHPSPFLPLFSKSKYNIVEHGHLEYKKDYFDCLGRAKVLPVTSRHDFQGISVLEAIDAGVIPLLPNRLTYPELIPKELHSKLIYEDQEFASKLSLLLKDGLSDNEEALLHSSISRFHWRELRPCWIHAFRSFEKKKS